MLLCSWQSYIKETTTTTTVTKSGRHFALAFPTPNFGATRLRFPWFVSPSAVNRIWRAASKRAHRRWLKWTMSEAKGLHFQRGPQPWGQGPSDADASEYSTPGWRRGVVVSGVRQWTKLTHVGPGYNCDGWQSSGGYTISGCNQPTRSTQPCIPPWSLNRVPASAGVKAGMSPLPGSR